MLEGLSYIIKYQRSIEPYNYKLLKYKFCHQE